MFYVYKEALQDRRKMYEYALKKAKGDVPHIPLGDLGLFRVRGRHDNLNEQYLAVRFQGWKGLAQYSSTVLNRPVMTDVTQHIHICPSSGLRLKEVMRHELHPCREFVGESQGTLLDCMLVILNN